MTLKEKFKQWLDTKPRLQIRDVQLEVIADEFAIEFAAWCGFYCTKVALRGWLIKGSEGYKSTKELLEIFKKQKGYV